MYWRAISNCSRPFAVTPFIQLLMAFSLPCADGISFYSSMLFKQVFIGFYFFSLWKLLQMKVWVKRLHKYIR